MSKSRSEELSNFFQSYTFCTTVCYKATLSFSDLIKTKSHYIITWHSQVFYLIKCS